MAIKCLVKVGWTPTRLTLLEPTSFRSTTIRGSPDSVGVHKVALNPDTDDLPTLIGTLNLNGFGRTASAAAYGGYTYIPTSSNFIPKVRCSALRGKTLIRREACTS